MSVLEGPMVFVDVETTGMSFSRSRIIEIAAIRVENGSIIKIFSSLVDPQAELPAFISGLTGITSRDLANAPTFYDIADDLHGILSGAVFVAHNVRFDYGFLKQEFKRIGKNFDPRLLCTVKLSKALYPGVRGHKLQDLIDRCNIVVTSRHRAYDDAEAMWLFLQHALSAFPAPLVEQAVSQQMKSPSLPKNLDVESFRHITHNAGVYIFYDSSGAPLYVGKSVDLKKRVLSHFSSDHKYESEFKISQQVHSIETIETGGELTALLLESKLIKDMQPIFNRQLRHKQKLTLVKKVARPDGFTGVTLEDVPEINPNSLNEILAVYPTKGKARQYIDQIVKDFALCPKLMGFDNRRGSCFSYQLKKCSGACAGKEFPVDYNARLLTAFDNVRLRQWPYGSPIVINEIGESDIRYSVVVDQWCVVASIRAEENCEPAIDFHTKLFDIDTYKILQSYISSKAHKLDIKPISHETLNQITAGVV